MTPAQTRLCEAMKTGWIELYINGGAAYRSPGLRPAYLKQSMVDAVKANLDVHTVTVRTKKKRLGGCFLVVRGNEKVFEKLYDIV